MSALKWSRTNITTTGHANHDSAASGTVASDSKAIMTARKVSELADWDGRQRQNAKSRRSSATHARDSYRSPLENQPTDFFQPPGRLSDQRRAEKSAFGLNLERDSLVNSTENARLPSRVDTTSTPSHARHHSHQASVARAAPNPALHASSFVTSSSRSSHLTPNSSVHVSRVHNPRPVSSRERKSITTSQSTPKIEPGVIDLTLEDTEDELSFNDVVVNSTNLIDHYDDPGSSPRTLSSSHSSPIAPERSLFTPPPSSRKRTRWVMDYLAVPSFPKGLTRADYQSIFNLSVVPLPGHTMFSSSPPAEPLATKKRTPNEALTTVDHPTSDHSGMPLPAPTVAGTLRNVAVAEAPVTKEHALKEWKGKERELDPVSPREKYKQRSPVKGTDVVATAFLDAFYEHAMIPIYDDDTYPPLTTLDLVANTRFQFAHAWREQASRLQEAGLDWKFKFNLHGKTCNWARSTNPSSPRLPGTAGYVSIEHKRPWEMVPPKSLAQEESTKHDLDEQVNATESQAETNCLSLPEDVLPGSSAATDPALPDSTVCQGPTVTDVERDMHQYFNGLGDSPPKHVLPLQQPTLMHTFRPHLLQSTGHAQLSSFGFEFPSLDLDSRLADAGKHECFLGVPPSPPPVDIESSTASEPIPDPPSEPVTYFPTSPGGILEASAPDSWSLEHGEGFMPDNDPPPNDHIVPANLGTIDPSLLGREQSGPEKPSQTPKDLTSKRRSKLPEPVIYIRRPIDSSSLPLLAGKRSVQIKYRDSGGSPGTPSTQTEATSKPARRSKQSRSDTEGSESPLVKRRSVPSRKLREYHTVAVSDPDYTPETSASTSKIKLKIKRPSLRESVDQDQDVEAETGPTMSYCHQCRNKSVRPKMLCSNPINGRVCGKRFCNRCILYRYPDITFDERSAGFLCPVCTNTCNCSFCSRNRGEEFISMRLKGLAAPLLKTKVTLVRDVSEPRHATQSPPIIADLSTRTTPTPEPSAPQVQSQFWAHVYGLEGERMGSAFMTREHMERLQTRPPSPPPPLPKQGLKKARKSTKRDKEREKPRGPRVFIGQPLDSWNVRAVRDLEPSMDVEVRTKAKGKERETDPGTSERRRRCYIGNLTPLYEPYERMPGTASPTPPPLSRCSTPALDSDSSLSPLSELEAEADDWPQPEVGECCSWAPLPPPGTFFYSGLLDPSGPSSSFAGEVPGPGLPGSVWLDVSVDGLQGQQGFASGSGLDLDVKMDVGDEPTSASTTLSDEAMARVISEALAALSVKSVS